MGLRLDNIEHGLVTTKGLGRQIVRFERRAYRDEIKEDHILKQKLLEAEAKGNIKLVQDAFHKEINVSKEEVGNLMKVIRNMMIISFRQIHDLEKIQKQLGEIKIEGPKAGEIRDEINIITGEINKFHAKYNEKLQVIARLKEGGEQILARGGKISVDPFNLSRESIQIGRDARRIVRRTQNSKHKVIKDESKNIRKFSELNFKQQMKNFKVYILSLDAESKAFEAEWNDTIQLIQHELKENNTKLINIIKELVGQGFPRFVGGEIANKINNYVSDVYRDFDKIAREALQVSR